MLERVPTWAIGLLVAVLAWSPAFAIPAAGLDVSWWSGLYMAAHERLQFGQEIVFTYGPLGFLKVPWLFYSDLAALAFVYSSAVFVTFCLALVWTLRRAAGPVVALVGGFLVVALVPGIEQALAIAIFAAFAVLVERPGDRALYFYAVGGGLLASAEVLMKLSIGPIIVLVLLAGLVGCRPRRGHLLAFGGTFLVGVATFWFAAGQSLSGAPDFTLNAIRITAGYNEAMAVELRHWWEPVAVFLAAAATVGWVWSGRYADRRARAAATVIAVLVAFPAYKQGIVRADEAHVAIFLTTMAMLWLAVPARGLRVPLGLAAAVVLSAMTLQLVGSTNSPGADPVRNVKRLADAGRLLAEPGRREDSVNGIRGVVASGYQLPPEMIYRLIGRGMAVEPWETSVAWAFGFEWRPPPVFQNYSAYTASLDRLNADAIASPDGPARVLREGADDREGGLGLDDRLQVWDPPAQAVATLCHFLPAVTADGWQLLDRVPDRCGPQVPAGEADADEGEPVDVPVPGPDEVILVRIHGAEPSPLRKLAALLYRPPLVEVERDDGSTNRLVTATAGDGLMVRSGRLVRGARGRFAAIPQTRTIAVHGAGDDLRFEFLRMSVR